MTMMMMCTEIRSNNFIGTACMVSIYGRKYAVLFKHAEINSSGQNSLLGYLRFFTIVPQGIFPSTNLADCADKCYTPLTFSFFPFSYFSST